MVFFKEPLVHFFLGGALIFGAYTWSRSENAAVPKSEAPSIHIGAGEVAWLQETWTRQRQQPADREEMVGLVTTYLKEELLAREAKEIGLDKDDTLVRRRLAQKLSFMLEDTFRLAEPSDDVLRGYFNAHRDQYQTDARVSFEQVYFDPEKRKDATADANDVKATLVAQNAARAPEDVGDRLLIEREMVKVDPHMVEAQFGPEFAKAIFALKAGAWEGPILSSYGQHLVRVSELTPAQLLEFADARARVQEDWYRANQQKEIAQYFTKLMEKYEVNVDTEVKGMVGPLDELLPQAIGGSTETQ